MKVSWHENLCVITFLAIYGNKYSCSNTFTCFLGLQIFFWGSLHSKPLHGLELISLTTITGNTVPWKEVLPWQHFFLFLELHFYCVNTSYLWTIALPVGVTSPAKRQKKTSCIYYQQDRSQSVHSVGGASYFRPFWAA